jgi:hypothetical protein
VASQSAPIAIFAFKRPDHLERALVTLSANHGARQHDVVAYVDGPRGTKDVEGVESVKRLLIDWSSRGFFRSFTLDFQPENLGLRKSILRGVGQLCDEAGRVIVIEDDLETSPWFLDYCRQGLDLYAQDPRVASIHGYMYPTDITLPPSFFLRGADCWGWATWKRAWSGYRDNAAELLRELRQRRLLDDFDHGGTRNLVGMLHDAHCGKVDSWAIRWHASAFLAESFTLYPGTSLVRNIGLDGSGTHCESMDGLAAGLSDKRLDLMAQLVESDPLAYRAVAKHFGHRPLWRRMMARMRVRL